MTEYICWIIVLSIIANALRGLHQAQAMCKPTDRMSRKTIGIFGLMSHDEMIPFDYACDKIIDFTDIGTRGHVWYRFYHAIDAGSFVAFAGLVWMLSHAGSWEPFGLALAVMWLSYEFAYSYGRYGTFIDTKYPENVNFFDVISFHASKWTMTAIRLALVAIMVALTIGG